MSFSSLLGAIQLGTFELGQVATQKTTGSFTATAFPDVVAKGVGGIQRPYTAVLGTIQLGLFQLGQVPAGSVTSGETTGKGSFQGQAFPDVFLPRLQLVGAFSAAAYPDVIASGNKGPLLVVFRAYPDVVAQGIFYYPDGAFVCAPWPDVVVEGVRTGAVVFEAFPDVVLSPLVGQQVSCAVGPNPPDGVISNYVY